MVEIIESFLLGLERPLILWIISQKPIHGYGIIKEMKRLIGIELKPGTLYPFLHNLEKMGFVAGKWIREDGRSIKCYYLTSKGEALLNKIRDSFKRSFKEIIMDFIENRKRVAN
ncbi:MAG: PadR family transcriptional regulator [Candidatus Bathyarchaeia archaeon]